MCSEDGLYLFLGHAHGLSVISSSTLTCVRTWKNERVELTSISCASLGNHTHLLCTVDDMGNFLRVWNIFQTISGIFFRQFPFNTLHFIFSVFIYIYIIILCLIRYCTAFCASHGEYLFNKNHQRNCEFIIGF